MANYKIIGGDLKEYGPATAGELHQWICEGRLSGQTLVQVEGTDEWKPLSVYPEFAEALQSQPSGHAPQPRQTTPDATWQSESPNGAIPRVQIGNCLARSGQLVSANFGLIIGAAGLTWLLSTVCQFLPFIGLMLSPLLHGVLYGGLYLVFLRRIRGEPAAISSVFEGFSTSLPQLMLVGLLTSLLTSLGLLICVLPGIYLLVAWTFAIPLVADRRLEFWSAMELSRRVVTGVWFQMAVLLVVAFLPVLLMHAYEQVKIFSFFYPGLQSLLSSGQPDFKKMIELMNQAAVVAVPLVFLSKVVLLFNLPFAIGALMYAYEDLFGARKSRDI